MALFVLSHAGIWYSQHFGCRWRTVYTTTQHGLGGEKQVFWLGKHYPNKVAARLVLFGIYLVWTHAPILELTELPHDSTVSPSRSFACISCWKNPWGRAVEPWGAQHRAGCSTWELLRSQRACRGLASASAPGCTARHRQASEILGIIKFYVRSLAPLNSPAKLQLTSQG